ncbi:hypothetical protein L596_003495 [Steinernema carpocapsae]|nr:hypothetical protein L596_003495 [Steinernema carpocapsae]
MVEGGFIQKWIDDYKAWVASQHHNRCDNSTLVKPKNVKKGILNLDKAQGAFWVFLSGIGLSFIFLLVENVAIYCKSCLLKEQRHENQQFGRLHSADVPIAGSSDVSEMQMTTIRPNHILKY